VAFSLSLEEGGHLSENRSEAAACDDWGKDDVLVAGEAEASIANDQGSTALKKLTTW
jgi:hypothetical protein